MELYKRVFATIDGGSMQHAVVDRAMAIAAANGAELVLGHVVDSVPEGADGAEIEVGLAEARKRVNAGLARELMQARCDTRIPRVRVEIRVGRVADALLDGFARPLGVDLVVCGKRGLSGGACESAGGVSQHLVRNADCDVLVVKQR